MIRVLRILKLTGKLPALKTGLKAIAKSVPNVIRIVLIILMFFLIFSVIGVSFFKGKFYYCKSEGILESYLGGDFISQTGIGFEDLYTVQHKWDCFNAGAEWKRFYYNFDNVI